MFQRFASSLPLFPFFATDIVEGDNIDIDNKVLPHNHVTVGKHNKYFGW